MKRGHLRYWSVGLLAAFACAQANADDSVRHALEERQGKQVTVVLESGSEMTGTVAKVESESLKLTQLVGKEYFDAVIALDQVQAVVFRAKP